MKTANRILWTTTKYTERQDKKAFQVSKLMNLELKIRKSNLHSA